MTDHDDESPLLLDPADLGQVAAALRLMHGVLDRYRAETPDPMMQLYSAAQRMRMAATLCDRARHEVDCHLADRARRIVDAH